MSISTSPFCEQCGAANEPGATYCSFCAHPLQAPGTANGALDNQSLLADTLLKGRYRIIKAVGQGGMGTVYRAQDTGLNDRAVAVKEMIVSGLSAREVTEATEAFKREATLLAALQHPNLPSVFEHFEENGRWYMVMSFIPGETLEDYLKRTNRNKLPLSEVLQVGKQLCTALYYLHSQYPPIIFRDVKPANIMRAPDGQIYLIDFGVARRFKPGQKKDTTPFGSIGYAPPEQFNKAQTTPRSDIYSMGATLHQLLSGHEPDSTAFRFPPLHVLEPTVPGPLATLIEEMLNMDDVKRPVNMLVVEQKLREISATLAPDPVSSSFSLPKPARQKRRRILRTAIMLLVIIGCIVGGGFIGDGIGVSNANTSYYANTFATAATTPSQANATATAVQIAALPDPYTPKGTLALMDPLDQANAWQEGSDTNWGGSCKYKNNALQISQTKTNKNYHCDENTVYMNFAIEVQMTISQGDCGGIVLRTNSDGSQLAMFAVCKDGTYFLYNYTSYTSSSVSTVNSTSTAIKQGSQANTIAVVAIGSSFDLYINGQKVESVSAGALSEGTIGLIADSNNNPTTVSYQDAMIWKLP